MADRCELNWQIKADNALLQELKVMVRMLVDTVVKTIPAIAEKMESVWGRVMIFCYQLSHIRKNKSSVQKSLLAWKPELERYTYLVQEIKAKNKERKELLAEKKSLPVWSVKKSRELTARIAELTEDLEELRSEKTLLLQEVNATEDKRADALRSHISSMETVLKKLEQ